MGEKADGEGIHACMGDESDRVADTPHACMQLGLPGRSGLHTTLSHHRMASHCTASDQTRPDQTRPDCFIPSFHTTPSQLFAISASHRIAVHHTICAARLVA